MVSFTDFADRSCPDWFAEPQLGIFVHWGMFAVPAWAPRGKSLHWLMHNDFDNASVLSAYAEWYQNAMACPESPTAAHHAKTYGTRPYADFRPDFDKAAEAFDADVWAAFFAKAGARYVVLVTKHHDGYCLWPTRVRHPKLSGWHTTRDFVGELASAVRARGLRFGLYYSGGLDWSVYHHPIRNVGDMLACVPTEDGYRAYAGAQVRELIARYKPDVLWNDIAWPDKQDVPQLFADYYAAVPQGVVNDRWFGEADLFRALREPAARTGLNAHVKQAVLEGRNLSSAPPHCDFRTVEYGLGDVPDGKKWEACRGAGLAFGHNQNELSEDFMTPAEFRTMRDDVLARGGNMLINIGPRADGSIPEIQARAVLGQRSFRNSS